MKSPYLESRLEKIRYLNMSHKTGVPLYKSRTGKLWIGKKARTEQDFLNEWTANHLFEIFPDTLVSAPEVKLIEENVNEYLVEFISGKKIEQWGSETTREAEREIYRLVRNEPQRYSALLHLLNGDLDRVLTNYVINNDGKLIVIDNRGIPGNPGYEPRMIMLHSAIKDDQTKNFAYADDPAPFKEYAKRIKERFSPQIFSEIVEPVPAPPEAKEKKIKALTYRLENLDKLIEAVIDGTYVQKFGGK